LPHNAPQSSGQIALDSFFEQTESPQPTGLKSSQSTKLIHQDLLLSLIFPVLASSCIVEFSVILMSPRSLPFFLPLIMYVEEFNLSTLEVALSIE
jgi:hypothetical protein